MENLLKNRNNRMYLLSVLVDNIGTAIVVFILPLMILDISGSVIHLSIISSFSVLPFLILGLPFGALVDKLNIKKILYVSDFIRFVAYTFLFIAITIGNNIIFIMISIYIVTIISSCTNVINTISELTFISCFVDDKDFTSMNSTIYAIQYIVGIAIPIMGAVLYASIPTGLIFLCCGGCFLISSLIVFKMNVTAISKKTGIKNSIDQVVKNILQDIKKGFIYLRGNPEVLYPLIIVAMFNILAANFSNDGLVMYKNILFFSTEQIGIIYTVAAIGSLIGTFFVKWLSKTIIFNKLFIYNIMIQFGLRIFFVVFKDFYALATLIFLIDICQSILNIIIITNRQKVVEKEYLGRVTSIYKTVLIGVNSVGYIYGGVLTGIVGAKKGILFSTLGILFIIFLSLYLFLNNSKKGGIK